MLYWYLLTLNNCMKTTDIFPLTIYEAEFPNYEEIQSELIEYIYGKLPPDLKNEYRGHTIPLKGGATCTLFCKLQNTKIDHPIVQQLLDFFNEHGKKYWETLHYSKFLNPYVLQLWANAMTKGSYFSSHNHNPTPISGTFYLNEFPGMPNLSIENPLENILGKSPLHIYNGKPLRNFGHEVIAKPGKLVLFPGWLGHHVEANNTDEIRLSMAVNFGCQGTVSYTEFI